MKSMGLAALGLVALSLQTSLPIVNPSDFFLPDPTFILALFAALEADTVEGAIQSFFLGLLMDLFSGAPLGLHGSAIMTLFFFVRLVGPSLNSEGITFAMLSTFAASFGYYPLLVGLGSLFGVSEGSSSTFLTDLPSIAMVNGLVAPFLFAIARRVFRSGEKDTPSI